MSEFYDQPVVVVSHTDLDGYTASAICKKRYPDCKIYYSNYGRTLPSAAFIPGCKMIVTDYSLLEHEFQKCKHLNINCIWIDHHKDNYLTLEQKGICWPGLRDANFCGAALAWKFLFPGREMPMVVQHVNDYDLWKFKLPKTMEFASGIQLFEQRPAYKSCFIWDKLLSDNPDIAKSALDKVISLGEQIQTFGKTRDAIFCKDLTYKATLQSGQRCLVAAIKGGNSTFFDSADKTGIDALCMSQYATDIKKYRCSVYSPDDIKEVLPIAKSFGGGGHPGAAGFQACDYPFPLPERKEPRPMSEVISEMRWILEARKNSPLVNQSACRSDRISLGSKTYTTSFQNVNKLCLAINHPYLSELIRILPSAVDLIGQDIDEIATSIVGYTLTNSGWYRCGFYSLDQSKINIEAFRNSLPKLDPNGRVDSVYEEDLGSLGKVMWWYSTDIPVIVPIDRITRK